MIRTKPSPGQYYHSKLTFGSRLIRLGFKLTDRYLANLSAYGPFNITLSSEKKMVWFRIPKAATNSTLFFLRDVGVKMDAEYAMDCYYLPALYGSWFKFTFVRNPWDRLVSAWKDKVVNTNLYGFSPEELKKMQDFEYFVKDCVAGLDLRTCDGHLCLQTRLMPVHNMDFIGRLENYDQDIALIAERLNLPKVPLRTMNATPQRKDYTAYYSPELKNLVGDWYAADVKMFDYEF